MRRRLVAWCVLTAPLTLLSLVLLVGGVTLEGRLAALAALLCVVAPALALARRRRPALIAAALLVACGLTLIARSPSGAPSPDAHTRAVYLLGGGPSRLAPTNLVPEVDQLVLATWLVWIPDPIMSFASAARLRGAIRSAYARGDDAETRALGSALGDAITDRDTGRMYVYEPSHGPAERRPAMLFLHGSAGSWKGYFQSLREVAEARRMGLAQPSFGFGNWSRDGGLEAVERARAWLASQPWVDPTQIYLVCLSNGGRAVTRVLRHDPARYRGLVFLSAVVEPRVLDGSPLDRSWVGAPALVLHGVADDRIPLGYADDGVGALREQSLIVRYITVADEDHYLIFTAHDRVMREMTSWFDFVERPIHAPR
jgi:pimeloyl-ACP methyl ester carboxylesterase